MDLFTVSFFGHRIVPEFWEAEARVESLIHTLLLEKEYVEFLVGRNGDFDQIVSSAVKRQQRRVREELRDNLENFEAYYDEIELCSAAAGSHPKGAIQIRNRKMVDRSDLVVFYVDHSSGGAYQTLRYAQRKDKEILNLAYFRDLKTAST